jgi:predicted P-loop ATPase/GTPase
VWGDAPTHHLLINETLPFDHGLSTQVEQLRSWFEVVHEVTSVAQARELTEKLKTEAIRSAHRRLCTQHDAFVYESFSHYALPWRGIDSLDTVIAVEPGFVYTFDPEEYLSAAHLPKNTRGNASVGRLLKTIEPRSTTVVPPARKADIEPQLHRILADLIPE